jgi:hypothetical protein
MATALDLIKRSMRLLGVYAIGEQPSSEEAQVGLTALNAMLDSLANSGQLVYAKSLDSISLSAGTAAYTVGPSGGTVSIRPVEVLDECYVVQDDVSYPISLITLQQYNALDLKTVQGIPRLMWVQPDMPNVTLTFWPVPDQAYTLKLWSNKVITGTLALTTTISLPPGYLRMLAYLLAEELSAEFQVPVPQSVATIAAQSRRMLKRTNLEVPQLSIYDFTAPVFIDIREM